MKFVFFGSSEISVIALETLKKEGLIPSLIVTSPDKPQGRGLSLMGTIVKTWATSNNIPFIQPTSLKETEIIEKLSRENAPLFVLVSYGKIIPKEILEIPLQGILNLHPSILPKLRGPSPIESSILLDQKDNFGISIIMLDEEMDHGPILAQEKIELAEWPLSKETLTTIAGSQGGLLLAKTMKLWSERKISPIEQSHHNATYTKKIGKENSFINLENNPYKNYLIYLACGNNPAPYFFVNHLGKQIRVKITKASYNNNTFTIEKVIPEGKKEMFYEDFKRGLKS